MACKMAKSRRREKSIGGTDMKKIYDIIFTAFVLITGIIIIIGIIMA